MELLSIVLYVTVFLFSASLVAFAYLAWGNRLIERRTVKKRLLFISAGGSHGKEKLEAYKKSLLKNSGSLDRLIFAFPRIGQLDRMLVKSGLPLNVLTFFLLSAACGGGGTLAGLELLPGHVGILGLGLLCSVIPFLFLKAREKKTNARFEEQLPEALDLLARALRSGHALSSGLEMIAQEMPDPIKSEFQATVDEIKLGLTFGEALNNLCGRMPSTDLKFFAISILIQKETGGNAAEILDRISTLLRERVRFRGEVKTLTAEGRLSGNILLAIPLFLFGYFYFANYAYISLLWTEQR